MAGSTAAGPTPGGAEPRDVTATLRSRGYVRLLILAVLIGAPISAGAYYFLQLVNSLQTWIYTNLPHAFGFTDTPVWWPLPCLAVAGLLTAACIQYLPGRGGHSPVDGFTATGVPSPADLPGILGAALATLALGAVLGPEAPLIALGAGLAFSVTLLSRRDVPQQAGAVVAASGSFAALSTLLGSPLIGAFLLMEATGLGGAALSMVLVPGLLASGIGSLIFVGLDAVSGLGRVSLTLPGLPPFDRPTLAEFGWAPAIGVAAAIFGSAIRWFGVRLRTYSDRRRMLVTPVLGLGIGVLVIIYTQSTGHGFSDVLFSGQNELGPLLQHTAGYSAPALIALLACKGAAYSLSLSSFRGGPVFPSMFLGAAGGIAMSHLPGLPLVAGVAMGIGAMCVVMLRLPLTSVLLATLLLFSSGAALMPLVIVAVVVAYLISARLDGLLAHRSPAKSP